MLFPSRRSICQIAAFASALVAAPIESNSHELDASDSMLLSHLVAGLGADTYATRRRSESRLYDYAVIDQEHADRVAQLLEENPIPPPDLEVYLAKQRLLNRLRQAVTERRMDRFVNDPAFDQSSVAGWDQFRQHAGDDLDSRLVFAATIKSRPGFGQQLLENRSPDPRAIDFDLIDRHDVMSWSIALSSVCSRGPKVADAETMRLTASLRQAGTGPAPIREHEQRVTARLIASYLKLGATDMRDRIVIGLRYDCQELVESDCRDVLSDPTQSPSQIVIAMLAASALDWNSSEIDQWLTNYQHDTRVSHVWRSVMQPKSTHRAQVRDVALALQLHRAGIDPRSKGFAALLADPILVFRPYSLGFETEQDRQQAHGLPRKSVSPNSHRAVSATLPP